MTTWRDRSDSYRNRMEILLSFRDTDVISRAELGDQVKATAQEIAYRLRAMEADGLVRLQRRMKPGRGMSKVIGIEITRAGRKWQKLAQTDVEIKAKEKETAKAEMQPCGQMYRVCFMASKCYLRDRCSAAVIQ